VRADTVRQQLIPSARLTYQDSRCAPSGRLSQVEIFLNSQAILELESVSALVAHRSVKQICLKPHLPDLILYGVGGFVQGPGYINIGKRHLPVLEEYSQDSFFLLREAIEVQLLRWVVVLGAGFGRWVGYFNWSHNRNTSFGRRSRSYSADFLLQVFQDFRMLPDYSRMLGQFIIVLFNRYAHNRCLVFQAIDVSLYFSGILLAAAIWVLAVPLFALFPEKVKYPHFISDTSAESFMQVKAMKLTFHFGQRSFDPLSLDIR
jgi:hypothetical protein